MKSSSHLTILWKNFRTTRWHYKLLTKSKDVSISKVLPDYGLEELEKIVLEYPVLTKKRNWKKKWKILQRNAAKSKSIYSVATVLDPRFKLAYVKGRKEFSSIKQKFLRKADPYSEFFQKNTSIDSISVDREEKPSWIYNMFKKIYKIFSRRRNKIGLGGTNIT